MTNLVDDLRGRIQGEVRFDQMSRALYSTDASIYQIEPVGVVIPRNGDDIQAVIELANSYKLPVLVRGGGTSLAGQSVGDAILLDCSKYMNQVLEVNAEEQWARVQPGVVLDQLNRHLEPTGLWFAPDVATSNRATVGGMMGNNSAGAHSIIYGKTIDHIISQNVILSDGTRTVFEPLSRSAVEAKMRGDTLEAQIYREVDRIVAANRDEVERRYPKVLRRVGGYNLDSWGRDGQYSMTRVAVGSEGTLVAVAEAKVRLVPRPQRNALNVVHFDSVPASLDALVEILATKPASIELIDKMLLDMTREQLEYRKKMAFVQGDPGALLVVEYYSDSDAELNANVEGLTARLKAAGYGRAFVPIYSKADVNNVFAVRKAGQGLLNSIKGDSRPIAFVEDTAVPPERLADYIRTFDHIVNENGTVAAYYAHASVGLLHVRPLINLKNAEGVARMRAIAESISDLVLEYGGALSGEHGDGLVRSCFNEKIFGPQLYGAFRELKQAFDPNKLMNPGKIVDAPPMTENLRYGPGYVARSVPTKFDYAREGGWARAIETCNGMGVCRKIGEGTMCPSFQVTREEEHSTRGRANALRLAMSGHLPAGMLTSRRMYDVLDLCLECKACKTECASNVDMAKLKYEFLDMYHQEHGASVRSRIFANINPLSHLGSLVAPLANWSMALPPSKWMLAQLGIARQRSLPPFAHGTFVDRMASLAVRRELPEGAQPGTQASPRKQVVLYVDTFMNYNYPSIGVAATRVLQAAGCDVIAPRHPCCGRPYISKGFLDRARELARQNVQALLPYAQQGIPIIGTEPSCLLTLGDEYLDFLPGDAGAKLVASQAVMLEEFLPTVKDKLAFDAVKRDVLIHGHCHQKSHAGMGPVTSALKLNPGFNVVESGAGCCGMAGSFGFEAEHYEVSMKVGEDRLFPKVRGQSAATEIAVSGVSCRQQIEHGTGRKARHWVEVMADALSRPA